jgi:hypothetical protein
VRTRVVWICMRMDESEAIRRGEGAVCDRY